MSVRSTPNISDTHYCGNLIGGGVYYSSCNYNGWILVGSNSYQAG